jgi:hypothetical protein
MKPVRQNKFSLFYSDGTRYSYGNCLVACIASWLDLDVLEVPNIYTFYGLGEKSKDPRKQEWVKIMNHWLDLKFGYELKFYEDCKDIESEFIIVRGKSLRNRPHTCIYQKSGESLIPFFDPHPTDQFLATHDYFITIGTISTQPL